MNEPLLMTDWSPPTAMRKSPCKLSCRVRRSISVVSATPAGKKAVKGTTTHREKNPSVVSLRLLGKRKEEPP